MHCVVYKCSNRQNSAAKENGISFFFIFPKDVKKRKSWVNAVNRTDWSAPQAHGAWISFPPPPFLYYPPPPLFFYFHIQLTLVISNSMGPWKKFESTVVRLKRSYEDTGSVVCLTTKGRQLERNFEELKPASHVPILGTILNIFDVFVAVFFSPLNSLNLMKRLITSRYLFLCEWICLSVLFMFFTCCIVIKLHPSWRIFLCAILFIYNTWCVFIIQ